NNPRTKGAKRADPDAACAKVINTCKLSGGFNAKSIVVIPIRAVTNIVAFLIFTCDASGLIKALYVLITIVPLPNKNKAAIVDCPAAASPANTIPANASGNNPCVKVGIVNLALQDQEQKLFLQHLPKKIQK